MNRHTSNETTGRPSYTTVLIVDDHPLFRTALLLALRAEGLDAHQLPVTEPNGILAAADRFSDAVVLLDLNLGVDTAGHPVHGAQLVAGLNQQGKRTIVLSGGGDRSGTAAAIAAGAIGSLTKSIPFATLVDTVSQAAAGQPIMTVAERQRWLCQHRNDTESRRRYAERMNRLSPREREVLTLLADGHRASAIAEQFVVALTTVRTQIRAILSKLEVRSQLEAVALFHEDPLARHVLRGQRPGQPPPGNDGRAHF
jgi:DNA-binding NarL/FixJ family response regulator